MKVVLFCGGQGTRLRAYSETIPKPMVKIGYRPILWNIMKYYAHYGHTDFILALGYKADVIKDYFVNYDEKLTNDFVYTLGGNRIELLHSDIDDWKITFVDTGISSNVGTRLMRVKHYLEGEEMFLANYADAVSNLYLPGMIDHFKSKPEMIASLMTYRPTGSFHTLEAEADGLVKAISPISSANLLLNCGYFIFKQEIFDYINYGEDIVDGPLHRLVKEKKLTNYHHQGFWQPMDTFKDKMILDDLMTKGNPPWEVWNEDAEQQFLKKAI